MTLRFFPNLEKSLNLRSPNLASSNRDDFRKNGEMDLNRTAPRWLRPCLIAFAVLMGLLLALVAWGRWMRGEHLSALGAMACGLAITGLGRWVWRRL